MTSTSYAVFAFLMVFGAIPFFRKIAIRFSSVTSGSSRRVGLAGTPQIGGAALVASCLFGYLLVGLPIEKGIGLGFVLFALGALDDLSELSASYKMPIEIFVATAWVYMLPQDMNVFAIPDLPTPIAYAFTVLWIVGFTNAMNLSDGIDGLSGTMALLGFAFVTLTGNSQNHYAAFLMGAVLAFLPYNFSKNLKCYLGDGGSLFLGFTLATMLCTTRWGNNELFDPLVAIFLVSYPQVDTLFAMIRRWHAKKRIMTGDRQHIHHVFVFGGFSHLQTTIVLGALSFLIGFSFLMAHRSHSQWIIVGLMIMGILISLTVLIMIVQGKNKETTNWIHGFFADKLPSDFSNLLTGANSEAIIVSIDAIKLVDILKIESFEGCNEFVQKLLETGKLFNLNGKVSPYYEQKIWFVVDAQKLDEMKSWFFKFLTAKKCNPSEFEYTTYKIDEVANFFQNKTSVAKAS